MMILRRHLSFFCPPIYSIFDLRRRGLTDRHHAVFLAFFHPSATNTTKNRRSRRAATSPPWSPGGGGGGAVKGVLRRVVSTDTVVSALRACCPRGWSVERGTGRKYAKAAISVELNRTDRQNSNKGRGAHSIYPLR